MSSPFSLSNIDEQLASDLQANLVTIESILLDATKSADPHISEIAGHLAQAGGKRFRPLLVSMASELGHPTSQVHQAAVVVELTHLASLYHDDVMDEAPRRRGTESVNARWTNTLAILTGDFLFARASNILSDLGTDAVRMQAQTFERLVSGQIRETVGPQDGVDPVKHHIDVLADKTGSLIATSARFGGMFAGLPEAALIALTNFGEAVGVAFQIADDLLDIASEGEVSGKTPGTDLREGIMTLPMLMVASTFNEADAELRALLGRELPDDDEHARALELMRAHPAMEEAQKEANRWATLAVGCLDDIRKLSSQQPELFADSARVEAVLSALEMICRSTAHREV
jgi:heptaprenyl diphosphate synthase